MPPDDRLRRDDVKGGAPTTPCSREPNPKDAVRRREAATWPARSAHDGQLVPEREDLQVQRGARPGEEPQRVEQRDDNRRHECRLSENAPNLNQRNTFGVLGSHSRVHPHVRHRDRRRSSLLGDGRPGQLGIASSGGSITSPAATPIPGLASLNIAAGGAFTCGRTGEQKLFCWGSNNNAQLGAPTRGEIPQPPQRHCCHPIFAVYPSGILEMGIPGAGGFSVRFTAPLFIFAYLPGAPTWNP